MQEYINNTKQDMEKVIEQLHQELGKVRTGRAHVSLLDGVLVNAYDSKVSLNQVALLTTPEAHQILVKPYDPNLIQEIEHGILSANLSLNPINDGENIRINIPSLTQETRQEIAKEVKAIGENMKIRIRNVRRDYMDKLKKDQALTKDDIRLGEDKIQELTNAFNKQIEEIVKKKEEEVLSI